MSTPARKRSRPTTAAGAPDPAATAAAAAPSDATADVAGPAGPPDEPAALERDIEQTREQLADTVEQLAHKVNVPARIKDTLHQASDTAQTTATQLKHQAQTATAQIAAKTQELGGQAVAKLPPPVRQRIDHTVTTARTTARQRPLPTAAVAVAVLVVVWRLWRYLRRAARS